MGSIKKKVLIEASKAIERDNDGHQRYVLELLRGLLPIAMDNNSKWDIHVHLGAFGIKRLSDIHIMIQSEPTSSGSYKKMAFTFKLYYYSTIARAYILTYLKKILPEVIVKILNVIRMKNSKAADNMDLTKFDIIHLTIPQFYESIFNKTDINDKIKLLTTIHDLTHIYFPHFHNKANVKAVKKGLDLAIERKSEFIAVSYATKTDFLSEYDFVSAERVHVVHEACDRAKFMKVNDPKHLINVRKKYKIPNNPFILTLSTLEPRKNIINMIKAFLRLVDEVPDLDINMIIAGKKGWKYKEIFKSNFEKTGRIFFTGFIDENDIPAIFSSAIAFSYVSYYEGFGLPLLEAMSCGTPVIYGNNSSMPEVVGNGGLPADPDNIEDIKDQFNKIILNKELRKELAEKALKIAKNFSIEKTIKGTLDIYSKILSSSN